PLPASRRLTGSSAPMRPVLPGPRAPRRAPAPHPRAPKRSGAPPPAHSSRRTSEPFDVPGDQTRVVFRFHFAANHFFGQVHTLFGCVASQFLPGGLAGALNLALRLLAELRDLRFGRAGD